MKPKSKNRRAREGLLEALRALEDPGAFCRARGFEPREDTLALAYAAGATKFMIKMALRDLGETIDPEARASDPASEQQGNPTRQAR